MLGNEDINWSVVTMRSIDRSTFRECFYDWDVKHVHGTAMVTDNSIRNTRTTKALFSDQPRMVTHHGRSMGSDPEVELVIRDFRSSPRASLRDGIAAVLDQDCPNTVFDLWIRHHGVPDLVDGTGRFQHELGSDVTLLQLLTDVDHTPSLMCLQPTAPPQSWRMELPLQLDLEDAQLRRFPNTVRLTLHYKTHRTTGTWILLLIATTARPSGSLLLRSRVPISSLMFSPLRVHAPFKCGPLRQFPLPWQLLQRRNPLPCTQLTT
jgi:hypothetical protein